MHNQPDSFPEVWGEMLDSPYCSVEYPMESHTLVMLISIFWID